VTGDTLSSGVHFGKVRISKQQFSLFI